MFVILLSLAKQGEERIMIMIDYDDGGGELTQTVLDAGYAGEKSGYH